MSKPLPAWLVFYGTRTAIVRARTETGAWERFIEQFSPEGERGGRLLRPTRDEVVIRRPRESDRGWIEDSRSATFTALLKEIPESASR